jgi:hypothetical protein
MEVYKYDFGTISYNRSSGILKVIGISKNKPNFVFKADEHIWKEKWGKRAASSDFLYIHNLGDQFGFSADLGSITLPYKIISRVDNGMQHMLRDLDASVERYNTFVSVPFEDVRKPFLMKIIDGDD